MTNYKVWMVQREKPTAIVSTYDGRLWDYLYVKSLLVPYLIHFPFCFNSRYGRQDSTQHQLRPAIHQRQWQPMLSSCLTCCPGRLNCIFWEIGIQWYKFLDNNNIKDPQSKMAPHLILGTYAPMIHVCPTKKMQTQLNRTPFKRGHVKC